MLWKFTNKNKYGNLRSRIVYRPDGEPFSFNPKGFGSFVHVNVFNTLMNTQLSLLVYLQVKMVKNILYLLGKR